MIAALFPRVIAGVAGIVMVVTRRAAHELPAAGDFDLLADGLLGLLLHDVE